MYILKCFVSLQGPENIEATFCTTLKTGSSNILLIVLGRRVHVIILTVTKTALQLKTALHCIDVLLIVT